MSASPPSREPDRWIVNGQCIVGIDHTATVLSILNMGADSGVITKTIHIVRDGRVAMDVQATEYIAFVRWETGNWTLSPDRRSDLHDPGARRQGRVGSNGRAEHPQRRSGSKAMAGLFALLPSRAARLARPS